LLATVETRKLRYFGHACEKRRETASEKEIIPGILSGRTRREKRKTKDIWGREHSIMDRAQARTTHAANGGGASTL